MNLGSFLQWVVRRWVLGGGYPSRGLRVENKCARSVGSLYREDYVLLPVFEVVRCGVYNLEGFRGIDERFVRVWGNVIEAGSQESPMW